MTNKHKPIRFILILLVMLLICGAMYWAMSAPRYKTARQTVGGMLDFTGADFSNDLFALNCEWEFYFDKLYTPADFAGGEPGASGEKSYIPVPLSWSDAGYPLYGCATYRLVIQTAEPELMILIPQISDSSIVWINGQKVFEAGRPGRTKEESVVSFRNSFVVFHPENGQAEIIVQASNSGWVGGGLHYALEIGRPDNLLRDAMTRRIVLGLFIGALMIIGLYHAVLFLHSRKDWAYLTFFLFCFFASIRFSVETNGFAALFLPGGMSVGLIRLNLLAMAMQTAALVAFIHTVFAIPITGRARIAAYTLTFAITLLVLLLPYGTMDVRLAYIALIPLLIVLADMVRAKRLKENPYNILLIFSLVLFIVWGPVNRGLKTTPLTSASL